MQTPRMISITNFPKKPTDKNPLTNIQDIFKTIYHASLSGGVVLCMCYFTVYADGLPVLGDIAQLLGLLVSTCSIAFAMIGVFAITLLLPSIFTLALPQEEDLIKPIRIFSFTTIIILIATWIYFVVSGNKLYITIFIASLIGISICLLCCFSQKDKNYKLFAGWSLLLVAVSFLLSSVCDHKVWLFLAFFFPLIYQIMHRKDEQKDVWKHFGHFVLYLLFVLIYCLVISYVYTLLNIESMDDEFFNITLFILLSLIVQVANIFVLKKGKNFKSIFSIALFSFLATVFLFTFVSQIYNRQNPLLVVPFSLLKLGYYPAELHFKKEFIKDTNFFNMDENITSNVFFILNSIGDEYIVRERAPIFFVDDNISLFAIDHKDRLYWYGKDENNNTKIYTFKDFHFQQTDEVNASALKETFDKDKTKKYTNTQVYRIKKSDVIYEINGKGLDNRNTTVYGR